MVKKGNQTPTRLLSLPHKSSLGSKAVFLYEKSGRKAQKWQVNIIKGIMAVNADGLWTHTKCGYSLPRRNGKNEVLVMREMYALMNGELVNHNAHRTTTSHTAWERLCNLLDAAGIVYESLRATGRERVSVPETGGRVEFRTRTTTGGLGEGFDLLVIDEAQEYTQDQESALKYVVSSSKNPQTIMCGTPPTPLSSGTVFTNFRNSTIERGSRNAFWAEWAVEEETDPHDKKAWYRTNPSLGTIITERSVQDEIGTDDIDFNIQRLGLWIKYNQKSAISALDWGKLKAVSLPKLTGPLFAGIKYGKDGTNVALSIAVKTLSGKIFVEAIDCRPIRSGSDWILDFLSEADVQTTVIDGASRQNILAEEMRRRDIRSPVLPTVKEVIVANGGFEQAIYAKSIRHRDQPSLTSVVTNCKKRAIGSSGGFGYAALYDDNEIALLDSVILAHWACATAKPEHVQKIRY